MRLRMAFQEQAGKAGVKVLYNGVLVTITVQEYSGRPTATRLLVGVLSSKDHIKADVTLGESKFVIEDTARSPVTGHQERGRGRRRANRQRRCHSRRSANELIGLVLRHKV